MKRAGIKKNRVWELDFMRGLAILLVVVDHAMYDIGYSFPEWSSCGIDFLEKLSIIGRSYMEGDLRAFWRPAFLFIFFFTSGICTAFSKNNFFRGVKLLVVAIGVTIVTFLADKIIQCGVSLLGVLHCLAIVILSYSAVEMLLKGINFSVRKFGKNLKSPDKIERIAHIAICLGLGAAFLAIHFKFNAPLHEVLNNQRGLDTDSKILGLFFYCDNWWVRTIDYFPLFPYISFFYFGAGVSRIFYERKKSLLPSLDGCWNKICTIPGRYSLIVYLAGQVVCVGLCGILTLALLGSL